MIWFETAVSIVFILTAKVNVIYENAYNGIFALEEKIMVSKGGSVGPVIDSVISFEKTKSKSSSPSSGQIQSPNENTSPIVPIIGKKLNSSNTNEKVVASSGFNSSNLEQKFAVANTGSASDTLTPEQEKQLRENIRSQEAEAMAAAKQAANERLRSSNTAVEFTFHAKSGRYGFKITDSSTGAVIKEYPPEETLDMILKLEEMVGLRVDKKL